MKNFLKKILTNSSIGAPERPTRVTFERNSNQRVALFEGQEVALWLVEDSYEINAYVLDHHGEEKLVAISHNYALARYIMRYDRAIGHIFSFDRSSITLDMNYK